MASVKRVVKQALSRAEETKILPCMGSSVNMVALSAYVFNPAYQVGQNVGSGGRVGRKATKLQLRYNFLFGMIGQSTLGVPEATSVHLRVMHLRSRIVDTAAVASNVLQVNPGGMTLGEIFYFPSWPMASHIDKNRWTVLMDKVYTVKAGSEPGNPTVAEPLRVFRGYRMGIAKKAIWREDSAANSQLVGGQTYLVFVADYFNATGGSDIVGQLIPTGLITWKDA